MNEVTTGGTSMGYRWRFVPPQTYFSISSQSAAPRLLSLAEQVAHFRYYPNTFAYPQALCPDLLRYEQIGVADNLRGRVVRFFFYVMRAWPVKGRHANP